MYKLDPVTLAPKDKNNRETHIYYLKHTMEQAAILREIIKQAKSLNPLDSASYAAYKCSKHMTGDRSQLPISVHKFLDTVKFNNDQIAKIMGYGDYQIWNITILRVYYIEGLGHNLFSVGQLCDSNLEGYDDVFSNLSIVQSLKNKIMVMAPTIITFERWIIRIDNETEFVNQTLRDYYEQVSISYETSVTRTLQQNGVFERKPDLSYLHIFGALCFPNNDSENLGKLQAKADIGPGLQSMTPATSTSGLAPNPILQQPCIPPPRDDYDRLFQPMFDEYLNPPTLVVSPVPAANVPRVVDLADSPVSTSINQDAPLTTIPSTK
nr:integrase, catalytic region, zinc finger, CCHC-type, peptidase aspartic, catalytic [Tanacetum cinerariifolium]